MSTSDIIHYLNECLMIVTVVSMVPVGCAAIVGVLVGLLQGITQIQDQTISFALRLIAVVASLIVGGVWMGAKLHGFGMKIFDLIPSLGPGPWL